MGRRIANDQVLESDVLVDIGHRLRTRRRELGLTMENVARASGISRVTLQKVEEGAASVSAGALASVALAVGLPLGVVAPAPDALPGRIRVGDFPGLASLAWQTAPTTTLTPYETWSVYARNWRHLDRESLSDDERRLIELLEAHFGGPSRV